MTQDQWEHLYKIQAQTEALLETKYQRGAKQHGGNLWNMSAEQLLDEAINEALDQITYLLTLREKLLDVQRAKKSTNR